MKRLAERPLVVPCPHCGNASGVPCTTPRGAPTNQPHTARQERWAAGWPGPAQAPKGRPTHTRPTLERAVLKAERRRERRLRNRDRARKRERS